MYIDGGFHTTYLKKILIYLIGTCEECTVTAKCMYCAYMSNWFLVAANKYCLLIVINELNYLCNCVKLSCVLKQIHYKRLKSFFLLLCCETCFKKCDISTLNSL